MSDHPSSRLGGRRYRVQRSGYALGFEPITALLMIAASSFVACGDDGTGTEPGSSPDTTPPLVVSVTPVNGTGDASIHTPLGVSFSEPVAFTASTVGAIQLVGPLTAAAGVVQRADERSLTFTPHVALDFATEYTATISTAVTDTAGNHLAQDYTWTFATSGGRPPGLDAAAMLGEIGALADDSMFGRALGSEYELEAAEHIRDRFSELGLEPGAPGYFQTFQIPPEVVSGQELTSQNVIGVLPGAGKLADQWVVVGAHYDHVGVSLDGEIRNGADDNASGTALLLDIARALGDYFEAGGTAGVDRRSIMFQAFGAEEGGLIGSRHYCENPTVPMADVAAMINFDMVGRLRSDELFVIGLWTSSEWDDVLARYNQRPLSLVDKRDCESCSDYSCFRRAGRPAIWFFTGFHPQYHSPEDDVELIDAPGMATIGDLVVPTLVHLAVRARAMPFSGNHPAP